ncbi:MAG: PAS domain-containing protein [Pelagimonas sp.]|uniref:hybrid sensor histidine kinase/response regulator n=1 Tax=Pelagimonas sp. TaxID=2073170 RepID=UPI003D6A135E
MTRPDERLFADLHELDPDILPEALKMANVGVLVLDLISNQVQLSEGLARLFGVDATRPMSVQELREHFMHEDDRPIAQEAMRAHLEEGKPYEIKLRSRHGSGEYRYLAAKGFAIRREDGTPYKMVSVLQDADSLERSKRTFRMAERLAKVGNWHVDLETGSSRWSDGMFVIHGLEPSDKPASITWLRSRIHHDDIEMVDQTIEAAIKTGEPFGFTSRIFHASGDIRFVRVQGEIEMGISGRAIGHYGTSQDVTDEIHREAVLRQSQKLEAVGKLAGGVAHDINNHLAVILGNLELLTDDETDPSRLRAINAGISAALNSAELTKNMLSYARKAPLDPKPLNLNTMIASMTDWSLRALPANIEIRTSLAQDLWIAEADQSLAQSAVLNLLINARDAMPSGGKITIETCNMHVDQDYISDRHEDLEPGRYTVLSISDTGHGIPEDKLNLVFDPFFTTKADGLGTGLGLSMVQGFLKQSKGTLRVYSEVGVGTTFNMFFKVMDDDLGESVPDPEPEPVLTVRHRILVAEDNPDVAKLLEATLTAAGFQVTLAESGDHAKEIYLNDGAFDVLLTDIVMPGQLQGPGLAQELRKIRSDLPIVFLSGYANEAKVHGNGLRREDIRLVKPVRRSDLLVAINRALLSAKTSN